MRVISKLPNVYGRRYRRMNKPAAARQVRGAASVMASAFVCAMIIGGLLTLGIALSGCAANSPYYVSGVQAGYDVTDTSKDGTIGISIAPNPYWYSRQASPICGGSNGPFSPLPSSDGKAVIPLK